MAKKHGTVSVAADHVFVLESIYPTESLDRFARGDTVPFEDCGWVHVNAGTVCRREDFSDWQWASFKANGLVAPLSADEPQAVTQPFAVVDTQVSDPAEQTGQSDAPQGEEG